jgi:hypothetical protein
VVVGSRTHSDLGVSLEYQVNTAAPTLPSAKNASLRVTVTVSSRWAGLVTFAFGELDPGFGNHPAYLALTQDGRALPAPELVVLPSRTLNVSVLAGTSSQGHTEVGPTLADVLRAAHIRWDLNTWVAAVGSDGYVATVTPAEAFVGGRPLRISLNEDGHALAQPRLVVDGDVKGGRYVSDVIDLVVGQGVAPHPGW